MILFDSINGEYYIGGPPLNVTLHMARKGYSPLFISAVGDDDLGDVALKLLAEEGVSSQLIKIDTHETGKTVVDVDEKGVPTFNVKRYVAYEYIKLEEEEFERLSQENFDLVYFGTIEQTGETTAATLQQVLKRVPHAHVFCDINLRKGLYTREIIDYSLSNTTILKLNDVEIMMLDTIFNLGLKEEEKMVDWLFKTYKIEIIILTRGALGATTITPTSRYDVEGIKVKVKDTVGSGDAFSAGFIAEYLETGDLLSATIKGNELGAYVASCDGAVPKKEKS